MTRKYVKYIYAAALFGIVGAVATILVANSRRLRHGDLFFDVDPQGGYILSNHDHIFLSSGFEDNGIKLVDGSDGVSDPTGRRIAFLSDGRLCVFDIVNKATRVFFVAPKQLNITGVAWHGEQIVFAMNRETRVQGFLSETGPRYDLYECHSPGVLPKQLTQERFFSISLSPQSSFGNSLYFSAGDVKDCNGKRLVYRLDVEKSIVQPLPETLNVDHCSVSPDGSKLLISDYRDGIAIGLYSLESKSIETVRPFGGSSITQALFNRKSQEIVFTERDGWSNQSFHVVPAVGSLATTTNHPTFAPNLGGCK